MCAQQWAALAVLLVTINGTTQQQPPICRKNTKHKPGSVGQWAQVSHPACVASLIPDIPGQNTVKRTRSWGQGVQHVGWVLHRG